MRWISCLIALSIVLGWFATQIPFGGGDEVARIERERWVRTRYGWENASHWAPRPPVYEPRLHPLAVAVAQVLLSTTALLAFPPKRQRTLLTVRAIRASRPRGPARPDGEVRNRSRRRSY